MKKTTAGRQIFYGWWVVAAGFGLLFIYAGAGFYTFGVLFKPLEAYFNAERATLSIAQSLFLVTAGLSGMLAGRLLERYKSRDLLLVGALIGSLAFFLLSQMTALWHLYLFYSLLGLGLGIAGIVVVSSMIANWFVRRRGMAIGITMAGIALGGLVLVRVTERLVYASSIDWRGTYIALGILVLAIDLPLALFVAKTKPQEIGVNPDGDPDPPRDPAGTSGTKTRGLASIAQALPKEPTLSMAARSSPFWIINIAYFMVGVALIGVLVHEMRYIEDMQIPSGTAATALAFTAGLGGVGKIGFGYLTDKIHVRYVAMFCFALQAVGILLLLQAKSMGMIWVFVVVFGISMGGTISVMPIIVVDIFGLASYGAIWGTTNFIHAFASILGPPLAGYIYDTTDSYTLAFKIFIVMYIGAIIATYLAWGPRPGSLRTEGKTERIV